MNHYNHKSNSECHYDIFLGIGKEKAEDSDWQQGQYHHSIIYIIPYDNQWFIA